MLDALAQVYGPTSLAVATQRQRYSAAERVFLSVYGSGPLSIFRAPGRVNLIGEHTDYSQGYVLPIALDRDVLLLARPRADNKVRLANVESSYTPVDFVISPAIPPAPPGHWSNYARGAAQLLAAEYGVSLGMDALVCGQPPWGIPRGAGLSSSSALTVVAALALSRFNGLTLDRPTLADACGRAEWYVGTRGGIMDQFASLLAVRDAALFLDCRPDPADGHYDILPVPLPAGHAVVVVDSGVRHQNTGPLFNTRVAEVRAGVALLQSAYPHVRYLRDMEGVPWTDYVDLLPERITLDDLQARGISLSRLMNGGIMPVSPYLMVRSRCRHVIRENARVTAAVSALLRADTVAFGELMNQAHCSVRDDYQVSVPELEVLIALSGGHPGVLGARLTGAGWGGCIVALVDAAATQDYVTHIRRGYQEATDKEAEAFVCQAGPAACQVYDYSDGS